MLTRLPSLTNMKSNFFRFCIFPLFSGFVLTNCSQKELVEGNGGKVVPLQKIHPAECVVSGKVRFGPLRPVEREGLPKPDSSKKYKGRSILIFSTNPKKNVAQLPLSITGRFECSLAPGEYIIDMKLRIPERTVDLPKHIKLTAGETLNFEIDINTGLQ